MASTVSPYRMRFVGGRYDGGEFPLPVQGVVLIGTSMDCDMVLTNVGLSKRHAKLTLAAEQVHIESVDGPLELNGRELSERTELAMGDRLMLGQMEMVLIVDQEAEVPFEPTMDLAPDAARAVLSSQTLDLSPTQREILEANMASTPLYGNRALGAASGFPEQISRELVRDLLELLSEAQKSGVLALKREAMLGEFVLDGGEVVDARLVDEPEIDAVAAFYCMLCWPYATWSFNPRDVSALERRLSTPMTTLMARVWL